MGFRSGSDDGGLRIRKLVFEDGEMEGLEVRVRGITVSEYLELDTYADQIELFAKRLVEWNWEHGDGTPVPPTRAGIDGLDQTDVRTVVTEWFARVVRAHSRPLGGPGQTQWTNSDEAVIPMGSPSNGSVS